MRNLRRGPQGTVQIANLPEAPGPSLVPPPPMVWGVDVFNAQGPITLRVDPGVVLPLVTVRAPELEDRTDPANWVAVEVVDVDGSRLLRIAAMGPEDRADVTLYLTVTIPASNGVHARTARGGVDLWDVSGAVDVECGDASSLGSTITIHTPADLSQGVRAVTNSGDVRVHCGAGTSGLIDMQGTRVNFVPARHGALKGVRQDARTFAARAGGGESPIEVRTQRGLADLRFDQGAKVADAK
jgi:hypothetical protein